MRNTIARTLFAASLAICLPAQAFGPTGHMAVGTIADDLLAGTNAGKEVKKILRSNLRTASVWADCAKGVNPATFKYGGDGKYPECKVYENPASKAQMIAFVRRNTGNCTSPHNTETCHKQYHYTDVAIQRTAYESGRVGTSDQDVVMAVNAAIAVLKGKASPAPFQIEGPREALRLLAHYVGDIHQPLHVGAVYLDKNGKVIDPDTGHFDPATETRGGNDLQHDGKNLHSDWDGVSGMDFASPTPAAILKKARAVKVDPEPIEEWSKIWATETLLKAQDAYKDITYSAESGQHKYQIQLPAGYTTLKNRIQREQIINGGARLAHILMAIWP